MRDASRYGSAAGVTRHCATCAVPLDSTRARFCSAACRQRGYRARHTAISQAEIANPEPKLAGANRVAHTVYECSSCSERFVGRRRCPECNLFLRALGLGGVCVHCDEPLLLTELLADGGATLLD